MIHREEPSAGVLIGREHHLGVRVYYENTDFTGLVYHGDYVRFFERGRSDFLRVLGVGHTALLDRPDPAAFVIARMEIDFRRPARIDDALTVVTTYERMTGVRLDARQRIYRGDEFLCGADVHAACIDLAGRPRRAPAELMERIRHVLPPKDGAGTGEAG